MLHDILLFYPGLKQKKSGIENNKKRPVKSNGPVHETKEVIRSHVLEAIEFNRKAKAGTGQDVGTPQYFIVLSKVETKEILTYKQWKWPNSAPCHSVGLSHHRQPTLEVRGTGAEF